MQKQRPFNIALRGFSERDIEVIRRICLLSETRQRHYRLADGGPFDIVLADGRHAQEGETTERKHPVVWVCDRARGDREFLIKRPLMAPRVLKMLDRVTIEALHYYPEMSVGGKNQYTSPVQASADGFSPPLGAYRILVADDSRVVRTQIGIILDLLGIQAVFAEDGLQALRMLAASRYDLVLMDVVMPHLDGLEATKLIKKRHKGANRLPVVLLTGKKSPIDRLKGAFAGCDTYLTKPVDQPALVRVLKQYLNIGGYDRAVLPHGGQAVQSF